jgi:hypothetical protein
MLLVGFFTTLLALGLFRKAEPLFAYFSPNTNNFTVEISKGRKPFFRTFTLILF